MFEEIFKYQMPIIEDLLKYGFKKLGEIYSYSIKLIGTPMTLTVSVIKNSVQTLITDDYGEEYTLYKVPGTEGPFVGQVREKASEILNDISIKCFKKEVFRNEMSKDVIKYVRQKYGDEFEYLWERFPDNAAVRRKDNKKWYALILTVDRNKLGLTGGKDEIIDVRTSPEKIEFIVDKIKIFPGYHMNKKHWITIFLDGSVEFETIKELIDYSYTIAGRR